MSEKICVAIPTYNNSGTLAGVLDDVLRQCADIIVVNDGSTDETPVILKGYGDRVTVVNLPINRGKGAALKAAFIKAREMGFAGAVTMDSDGQHHASDIPLFIKAFDEHPGSMIVGTRRFLDLQGISLKNLISNRLSNFWFFLETGVKLHDTQGGFRLYPLDRLGRMSLLTNRYEAEMELLESLAWKSVKIIEVPIDVEYPEDRVSHFRPAADFSRFILANLIFCIIAVFYGFPRKILNK